MGLAIKYLPSFVEGDDSDYIPVKADSYDDLMCVPWIAKWALGEHFVEFRSAAGCTGNPLTDVFFTSPKEMHGLLYARCDYHDVHGARDHLIAFVSDVSIISHLKLHIE